MASNSPGGTVAQGVALTKDAIVLISAFVGAVGAGVKVQWDVAQVAKDQVADRLLISETKAAVIDQGKLLASDKATLDSLQRQVETLGKVVDQCYMEQQRAPSRR
jgi:hypothetical protein